MKIEELKILVADDDPGARELVSAILSADGWPEPVLVEDGERALEQIRAQHWDILVTDLDMPRMRGDDLVRNAIQEDPDLSIVVTTGDGTVQNAVDLMKSGATDFIAKPYDVDDFIASMQRARMRALNIHEVKGMRDTVEALLVALESKDKYLNGHSVRVRNMAIKLGALAGLDRGQLRILGYAALLHDVGKIGVHEDILNKTDKLTDEEYKAIQRHPEISAEIIAPVPFLNPSVNAVRHHHERWDGRGYPDGLSGEQIPLMARIISVVDAFDAMTSDRSYRSALSHEVALQKIQSGKGEQFDPRIADLFDHHKDEILVREEVTP
ncbi:MAG: response regulator [Planctomycetia bacterium]|nr:response regulator [Planctomycetia bacterium]MBL6915825.1 response regulator [Planctomycetota bacterium]NCF54872.1 response regulator [Planctomycetia bacterium]NCG12040.1 response regulator [Planctomycetia bacterium]